MTPMPSGTQPPGLAHLSAPSTFQWNPERWRERHFVPVGPVKASVPSSRREDSLTDRSLSFSCRGAAPSRSATENPPASYAAVAGLGRVRPSVPTPSPVPRPATVTPAGPAAATRPLATSQSPLPRPRALLRRPPTSRPPSPRASSPDLPPAVPPPWR